MQFRRSDHLAAHWSGGILRVRNYATGRTVNVQSWNAELLGVYGTWRSVEAAARLMTRLTPDQVAAVTADLHRRGLLHSSDDPVDPAEERMRLLAPWNPAAGFFHSLTRDVRFAPLSEGREAQLSVAAQHPWPGASFRPAGAMMTRLPRPQQRSAVTRAFLNRRSWRRFGSGALPLRPFSTLLWLTGGIQRWVRTAVGEFAFKTSPSGGSLHPIELYVLVRTVRGLDSGMYHYNGADHGLALLRRQETPAPIVRYLPQQPWFEGAAAAVFFVAHYERALWRYNYARAYRAPFIEAGHLAQTFCVKATELGLAPFVSMALADSAIEAEIGADGTTRAVLYAAGVGVRPAGVKWAPEPEANSHIQSRPNRIRRSAP